MHFSRISIADKQVALSWTTPVPRSKGVITHALVLPDKPLASFVGAMQAFSGFALSLIGAPPEWDEGIKVTTLNFKEDKAGRRTIQVSISHKISQAKNRGVSITTPLMSEADEDVGEGEAIAAPGYYGSVIGDLIEAVESEATRYKKGEREQLEAFAGDTSTATDGDAPAPRSKGKGSRKNRDFIPGVGPVMNADATEAPTDENLRQLLLRAERDVPVDAIAHWNSKDRDQAQRWATAVIRKALGEKPAPVDLIEPDVVKKDATLPLIAGGGQKTARTSRTIQ